MSTAGQPGGRSTGFGGETSWPSAVPGTRFGSIRHLGEVDSTNRVALEAAEAGAPEGLVVVADHQRAGRGRMGRRWEAPPGENLLVSVLLRPGLAWVAVHRCTAALALAAADACGEVAGLSVGCKWPNDLVVADRKLGGILAETTGRGSPPAGSPGPGQAGAGDGPVDGPVDGPAAVVAGLGLNVGWCPPDPPTADGGSAGAGDAPPVWATSLLRETGRRFDRVELLVATLRHLERRLVDLAGPDGGARLRRDYRGRCVTVGRRVAVLLPRGRLDGVAVDVTETGALVVDDGSRRHEVTVGDVVHVRPGG